MAFPLLGLIPGILRTIASITGLSPVKEAADAIQNAQLSPEKLAELQEALQRHELAMKALSVDELKTAVSESVAMITSPDKYVSRARPSGLYAAYAISTALAVALVFGVKIDAAAILTLMGPMYGAASVYVWRRTSEKLGGNGNSE